ncbi:hypothetical protein FVE85_6378 [Porphyridium purpureum]|uniref:Uncharacterized protein n=1 Tax=Porphyridium purpureum TaxID=35688 RepID=A0A5J4Z7I9_PORPP|nr:hypothetical protein FVE85_6378 [Porphyridium purpureum]|eukprot:POR0091..scf295_1
MAFVIAPAGSGTRAARNARQSLSKAEHAVVPVRGRARARHSTAHMSARWFEVVGRSLQQVCGTPSPIPSPMAMMVMVVVVATAAAEPETVNVVGDRDLYLKIFGGGIGIIMSGFLGAAVISGAMSEDRLKRLSDQYDEDRRDSLRKDGDDA